MLDNLYIFYIFCIVVVLYYLFNKNKNIENLSNISQNPEKAAEACKKISSQAENIKAAAGGVANVISSVMGLMNPRNYKSGDNEIDNFTRNVITTDMSNKFESLVNNQCSSSVANMQVNEIDFTKCKYCDKHECSVSNVTQTNISKSQQTCRLKAAIDVLMAKKDSIDAQALAKVVQESEGLLSGNNSTSTQNCNIIDKDMSSKEYLDIRSNCNNDISMSQRNSLKNCGGLNNVIQKNLSNAVQQCIMDSSVKLESKQESDTKIVQASDVTQKSIGLDMAASLVILSSCCVSSIISSVLAGAAAYMQENGQFPQSLPKFK